jgi:hypothetical protein
MFLVIGMNDNVTFACFYSSSSSSSSIYCIQSNPVTGQKPLDIEHVSYNKRSNMEQVNITYISIYPCLIIN